MDETTRALALEVARCPVITAVFNGESSSCEDVITFQKRPVAHRWVAEPWSGHLQSAPILFMSSNPNSGEPDAEIVPADLTWSSRDETILHAFDDAFDPGPWPGIREAKYLRGADGSVGDYVPYWGFCLARASELLGTPARPGQDYALTEVVHCGSKREIGVWRAAEECVPRYLERLMALSPAIAVVVVGKVAKNVVRANVGQLADTASSYAGQLEWAGRLRHVLFLPHPNARGVPKRVTAHLEPDALAAIRISLEKPLG